MAVFRILPLFALTIALAASPGDSEEIRSMARDFNELMRRPDPQLVQSLFTADVDFRDATHRLKGPDAIVSLLRNRQIWSERTQPILQEESIKLVGQTVAFVDAQLVWYGSMVLKSSVPVVLLLEKEEGVWKISSWRMAARASLAAAE